MWVLAPCIWISAPNLTIVSFRWCWGRGRWVPKDLLEVSSLVSGKKFPPTPWNCLPTWGSFLSVDRLSLQHLVCRCNVLNRSLFWKICEKLKAWKVDDRVFSRCWTSWQHLALALAGSNAFCVSFAWIHGNSLEKLIDARIRSSKDNLELSRADFSTLQTKSINGQKRPSCFRYKLQIWDGRRRTCFRVVSVRQSSLSLSQQSWDRISRSQSNQ